MGSNHILSEISSNLSYEAFKTKLYELMECDQYKRKPKDISYRIGDRGKLFRLSSPDEYGLMWNAKAGAKNKDSRITLEVEKDVSASYVLLNEQLLNLF